MDIFLHKAWTRGAVDSIWQNCIETQSLLSINVPAVQITHPVTGSTLRVWFESPVLGRPSKEDARMAQDQRLLPRECREAVRLLQLRPMHHHKQSLTHDPLH